MSTEKSTSKVARFPNTILVATDFDASADAALDRAVELAAGAGSKVHLLHVYTLPVAAFPHGDFAPRAEAVPQIVSSAEADLANAIAKRKASGVEIVPMIKQGTAVEAVLAAITEVGADLVILGTHGRRGLARAVLGSVAESIIRSASIPVMTVRVHD